MPKPWRTSSIAEWLISLLALSLVVFYIYSFLNASPYVGFKYARPVGRITRVYTNPPGDNNTLQIGDRIRKVNDLEWQEYYKIQPTLAFSLIKHEAGDTVDLTIQRQDQFLEIKWTFPPLNRQELLDRIYSFPWILIVLLFWVSGVITLTTVRPRNERRFLLAAYFYLLAVWIVTNAIWQVNYSGYVATLAGWIFVPLAWHLHWVFPKPLRPLNPSVWIFFYMLAAGVAFLDLSKLVNLNSIFLPISLGTLGTLVLLGLRLALQPDIRRQVFVLLSGFASGSLPVLVSIMPLLNTLQADLTQVRLVAALFSAVIPASYYYVITYHKISDIELRASTVISYLSYGLIVFWFNYLVVYDLISRQQIFLTPISSVLVTAILNCLVTAIAFPPFKRWVENRLLGMSSAPEQVLTSYASRILTAADRDQLIKLMEHVVLPNLLIRQAALLRLHVDEQLSNVLEYEIIAALNANLNPPPTTSQIQTWLKQSGSPIDPEGHAVYLPLVVRLALSKAVSQDTIFLGLFGRRDPDDYYGLAEIPTLQTITDNVALAMVNIEQNRLIHTLYQENIDREERERSHIALHLHDDVLNQLALLAHSADETQDEAFYQAYKNSILRIREIIGSLRPPLLNYGLGAALNGLMDEVASQAPNAMTVEWKLPSSANRYPEDVELHLYRIIQQACMNAIKHSQATRLMVSGQFNSTSIEITIQDNGVGLPGDDMPDLSWLIQNKHYGLAGMFERAELIGAKISIHSEPGAGAEIRLSWDQSTARAASRPKMIKVPTESLPQPTGPLPGQDFPQVAG
ncbi:MAG: ATP-binding protein [Anaerolineales bacterium]|jgi:signal transduction histidine kinase|nr:ATP-binding protein [Anaerolineales bacterium]